jgi:hypothetical protein
MMRSCRRWVVLTWLSLLLLSLCAQAAWPEKGPYLIYEGNPTEMVVLWQTRTIQQCSISWGIDEACSDGSILCTEYGDDHQYRVTLTDLLPDTLYFYHVTFGTSETRSTFRSAPSPDTTRLRLLAWTDTQWVDDYVVGKPGTGSCMYSSMASSIRDEIEADPTLQSVVLHGGDWVGGPLEEIWAAFFRKPSARYVLAQVPMQGCIGNHDVGYERLAGDTFAKYWSYPFVDDHYWSFDYGPVHFVILDLYTDTFLGNGTDERQLTWLTEDLRSHNRPWTVAIFHNPLCESGSGSCGAAYNALYPILSKGNVDVLYTGHWHKYYVHEFGNIIQIVGGTASGGGDLVYSLFDFSGDTLRIETKWGNGKIMDVVEVERR